MYDLVSQEKPKSVESQDIPKVNGCHENGSINQFSQPAKEEKIRELNQQVDSLQNVILQVGFDSTTTCATVPGRLAFSVN